MDQENIKALLPAIFQRAAGQQNLLNALVDSMEALQSPTEAIIENIDLYFDPYRAPEPFVFLLAHWVDLDSLWNRLHEQSQFSGGIGRLRELVAAASTLSRWRGTSTGLILFLQTATGLSDFRIDEEVLDQGGVPRPFHIRIIMPAGAAPYRALIERIIALEKPAYMTHELVEAEG
jgi:phage tail-like protein